MESILFKCSDFVVVQFKDMDSTYARRGEFSFPKYTSWFIGYVQADYRLLKKEVWAFKNNLIKTNGNFNTFLLENI